MLPKVAYYALKALKNITFDLDTSLEKNYFSQQGGVCPTPCVKILQRSI